MRAVACRASAILVVTSILSSMSYAQTVRRPPTGVSVKRTFVPQWHLGDRWEVRVEEERERSDGRLERLTNRYRFDVRAFTAPAPGVREVHVQVRPWVKRAWRRAHLVFVWEIPGPFAPEQERLYLRSLTVLSLETPPRQLVLDFGALSAEAYPVLMFGGASARAASSAGALLPVSFPVFEVRSFSGSEAKTYRPSRAAGVAGSSSSAAAPRDPPAVRQVLVGGPVLPEGIDMVKVDPERVIEYRLEAPEEPLAYVRQVWDPNHPWWVFERGPGRRAWLTDVQRVQGDPMALVERAAAWAQRIGSPGEPAALASFRGLLTQEARAKLERDGAAPVAPATVADRTRALLAGFGMRGLTPIAAYAPEGIQAVVEVGGLSSEDGLERRAILCAVESGEWKLASGAEASRGSEAPVGP